MPELISFITQNPLLIFLAITNIIFAVLFLMERDKETDVYKRNQILIEQIQNQSAQVLQDALVKAQGILEKAAVEESQLIEDSKQNVVKIEQTYSEYLINLQKRAEDNQAQLSQSIQGQTTSALEKIEQTLADFLNQTQQQSIGSIQLEIQAARQLVETYKRRQLSAIDENIMAILERTMGRVISKRLTLKDHVDMVYDALEKAKLERFIV
jgi:hypothetical protein